MPQGGKERRMVLRLLEVWRAARGERAYPSLAQFDETTLPELWPFCFALDVTTKPANPVVVRVGRSIASYCGESIVGKLVSEIDSNCLPAQALAYIEEVLRKKVPISRGGAFQDARGVTVLYRSIVLPTSEDGETVAALIGAANCREVAGT